MQKKTVLTKRERGTTHSLPHCLHCIYWHFAAKHDSFFVVLFLRGSTPEEATDDVVNYQIPKLQELMKNEELNVDNIDVFCEKGVFGLDETRRILEAGKAAGLALNFHGDELHPMKAAEVYKFASLH